MYSVLHVLTNKNMIQKYPSYFSGFFITIESHLCLLKLLFLKFGSFLSTANEENWKKCTLGHIDWRQNLKRALETTLGGTEC